MTPIDTTDDVRLVTLVGVAIDVIEDLALAKGKNPEEILAERLYLANRKIHERGAEEYIEKLTTQYSLLYEAIA